jgi:hypothetical protein
MKLGDHLLFANDLEVLYDAFNDLLSARDEMELDNPQRVARIVYKFERFVSIHEVRTGDLVTLKDKVEDARTEYRILKQKYIDSQDVVARQKQLIDKILNQKMDDVNN